MTMLRVKNGACAPLRLRSMLSRPATGITCIAVTTGAPEILVWAIAHSSLLYLFILPLVVSILRRADSSPVRSAPQAPARADRSAAGGARPGGGVEPH